MSSITPSPPYMPPHPAMLKQHQHKYHNGGIGNNSNNGVTTTASNTNTITRHHHQHTTPVAGVHGSSFQANIPSHNSSIQYSTGTLPGNGLHNHQHTHLTHHQHTTPHSTLQSSSSNQSSTQGGSAGAPHGRGRSNGGLNMSSVSSKQSLGGNSGSVSPGTTGTGTRTTGLDQSRDNSHLTDISHISRLTPLPPKPHHLVNTSNTSSINSRTNNTTINSNGLYHQQTRMNGHVKNTAGGISPLIVPRLINIPKRCSSSRGLLHSLCLLCLISVMLGLLALTFLMELLPGNDSRSVVREVTVALAAITLALDLFCALVCAVQFVLAVKLPSDGHDRASQYLQQSSMSRVCAIFGFFLSVPLLLTGVVLHSVLAMQSVTAVVMSACIGIGVVLCCLGMLHSLLLWKKHKRRSVAVGGNLQANLSNPTWPHHLHSTSSPLPPTTIDLSASTNPPPQELSTLV